LRGSEHGGYLSQPVALPSYAACRMRRPEPSFTRRRRFLLALLGPLAIAAVAPRPALAQGRGEIRGVVTGAESGEPIAGARVAVASPARVTRTSERGAYVLRDLPAGRYEVTVTALGRQPRLDSVSVVGGGTARLDVVLAQGSLMLSSVVVSATRTVENAGKVASTVNRSTSGPAEWWPFVSPCDSSGTLPLLVARSDRRCSYTLMMSRSVFIREKVASVSS